MTTFEAISLMIGFSMFVLSLISLMIALSRKNKE